MKFSRLVLVSLMCAVSLSGCAKLGLSGGKDKKRTPVMGNRISILSSEQGIEPDPALAGVQVVLPEAALNADWAQPGGNASKSVGHLAMGQALGKLWTVKINGSSKAERLAAAPVVSGGNLYAVDVNGVLNAFSASTGRKLWAQTVNAAPKGSQTSLFGGGVSVDGDTVFATNGLGDVVAMDAASGNRKWKVHPAGPLRGAPTVSNGNVYVMTQDSQLLALSQADGSTVWTQSASLEITGVFGNSSPAAAQGSVVAGFSSGELNAYRYENGRPLWGDTLSRTSMSTSVSSLSDIDANPVIDRGRVFAIGQGGRMVSMDLVTGQRLWELSLAGVSSPWVAGEWVFVVDDQARLLCVSRTTGKVRWLTQLQRYKKQKEKNGRTVKAKDPISWVGPVLAGGRLILANSRGELFNVAPETGAVQTRTSVGAPVSFGPVVANNTLYIMDDEGRISAWR